MEQPPKYSEENENNFPRICIIGAGFSGLCAAVQLKRKLKINTFTVYESNEEIGGCWLSNNYPGCGCMLPSHLYSFSFAPKSDWTHYIADRSEILEYMKSVVVKFDISPHLEFGCEVRKLTWNEELKKWRAIVFKKESKEESEILYDIVITGSGQLRIPHKPSEFDSFQGPVIHSAEWDSNIDLRGKRVAVIGSGASAIQLIPALAAKVSKLISYQRSPTWIIPAFQFEFGKMSKWALTNVPGLRRGFRTGLFLNLEFFGPGVVSRGTLLSNCIVSLATFGLKYISKHQFKDFPGLKEKLAPKQPVGCKVVGITDNYYSTFKLPSVQLINNKIVQVRNNTILTEDGREEIVDILILATGFRPQDFFAPMEIIGKNSVNILLKWKESGPSAYLGIMNSDMPNYFTICGPGSSLLGSFIFQIECQVHYTIQVLKDMMKQKAKSASVQASVESEYMTKTKKALEKTVYGQPDCKNAMPWLLRGAGLYPGTCTSYWKRTRSIQIRF